MLPLLYILIPQKNGLFLVRFIFKLFFNTKLISMYPEKAFHEFCFLNLQAISSSWLLESWKKTEISKETCTEAQLVRLKKQYEQNTFMLPFAP